MCLPKIIRQDASREAVSDLVNSSTIKKAIGIIVAPRNVQNCKNNN